MRRLLIFILVFLIGILFINYFEPTIVGYAASTLKDGQTTTIEGKTITIEKISPSSVVVNINGVKEIVYLNEENTINGVEIVVTEIFYVAEKEDRLVKLNLNVEKSVCGNGICEIGEDCDSCKVDCGCDAGHRCINSECRSSLDECIKNQDCDDDNEKTVDVCRGSPKKCYNIAAVICSVDEDCDDVNDCTEDKCIKNDCFNVEIPNCKPVEKPSEKIEKAVKEMMEEIPGKLKIKEKSFFEKIGDFFRKLFKVQ